MIQTISQLSIIGSLKRTSRYPLLSMVLSEALTHMVATESKLAPGISLESHICLSFGESKVYMVNGVKLNFMLFKEFF